MGGFRESAKSGAETVQKWFPALMIRLRQASASTAFRRDKSARQVEGELMDDGRTEPHSQSKVQSPKSNVHQNGKEAIGWRAAGGAENNLMRGPAFAESDGPAGSGGKWWKAVESGGPPFARSYGGQARLR